MDHRWYCIAVDLVGMVSHFLSSAWCGSWLSGVVVRSLCWVTSSGMQLIGLGR